MSFSVGGRLGGLPELLGDALAQLWLGYGLALFIASTFDLNLIALGVLIALAHREAPSGRWLHRAALPLEIVYCLINPLAYLLILVRTSGDGEIFVDARQSWLDLFAWMLLSGLWVLRFLPLPDAERRRRWARGLLVAGLLLLGVYFVRDVVHAAARPAQLLRNLGGGNLTLWSASALLGILSLYLIPAAVLLRFLRSAQSEERWRLDKEFVRLSGQGRRIVFGGLLLLVASTAILLHLRPSEAAIRQELLSHRPAILEASRSTGMDPRLLASVVYAVQRRQGGALAARLDRILGQAWARDDGGHLMLSDALDPSIGLAQIKPLTAQTALQLVLLNPPQDQRRLWAWKEYRQAPHPGPAWGFAAGALSDLSPDPAWLPGKAEVFRGLVDEPRALWMCALVLELYARQWEQADPAWSIRDRPEILATLYQLGFENSQPKPEPAANRFGEQVGDLFKSPWIQASFSPEDRFSAAEP